MRHFLIRAALIGVTVVMLAVLVTGCTLTGAEPAPLTPVGEVGGTTGGLPATEEPTQEQLPPTPTETGPIDVFGTQTAQAPLTPEATEEATIEPGGAIEPTTEPTTEPSIITPTPEVATTPVPGGTAECPSTHTVAAGENLFRIALRYGLTTDELAAANGITNPSTIVVGTVLRIPNCDDDGTTGGTGTPEQPTDERTHVVAAGENLFRIAMRYNITWQELADYNGITNPASLYVGQVLRIP